MSNANAKATATKLAQERCRGRKLGEIVLRGSVMIRKTEDEERIIGAFLEGEDAAALYAVLKAFYSEKMPKGASLEEADPPGAEGEATEVEDESAGDES